VEIPLGKKIGFFSSREAKRGKEKWEVREAKNAKKKGPLFQTQIFGQRANIKEAVKRKKTLVPIEQVAGGKPGGNEKGEVGVGS